MSLLAGARDTLVDVHSSQQSTAMWEIRNVAHPAEGHDLPLDDPAWVIEQIPAWLEGIGTAQYSNVRGSAAVHVGE
jgi:hypothetical protein